MNLFRRVGWGVVSQVAVSATNFVISIFVARTTDLESFGQFALVFLLITLLTQFSRSTLGQALLLDEVDSRTPYLRVQGVFACLAAVVVGATALLLVGPVFGAVAFVTAVLAVGYDGFRYANIRRDHWRRVGVSDCVTLALVTAGGSIVSLRNMIAPSWMLAIYATALAIGWLLLIRGSGVGSTGSASEWVVSQRKTLIPLTGESGIFLGVGYSVNWIITAVAGVASFGVYRVVQTAMTPVGTLSQSATVLLVSRSVASDDQLGHGPRGKYGALALGSGGLIVAALVWTVLLYLGAGQLLFDDVWESVSPYVWWAALGQILACISTVANAIVKRLSGALAVFRLRLFVAWADPLLIGVGAAMGSVGGAVAGLVLSQTVVAIGSVLLFRVARKA